jgi:ABC-type glycerol-3-phosphate transport system permease component
LRNFFKTIPKPILESAKIDGCGDWQVLQKIIMPLSAPALVALILVNALWVWNELLIALILLQSEKMRSLMVGLTLIKGRFTVNQPLIMAGMLSAALPMLILYLIGQGYFIRGLAAGAVTGE